MQRDDLTQLMNNMARASRMAAQRVASDFRANMSASMNFGEAVTFEHKASTVIPSGIEIVTKTDRAAEAIIAETLHSHHPDIPFVGEECGGSLDQPRFFLIDPLDGTNNFTSLRAYFAVCAAYIEDGEVLAAVIADPYHGTLIKAAAGHGAFFEDTRGGDQKLGLISRNESANLSAVQLDLEISMTHECDMLPYKSLLGAMSGFRKMGSTALDLYNMALGRNMGLIADKLAPHDLAAGLLIMREVGGIITEFKTDAQATYKTPHIMAARPSLHSAMRNTIRWR